MDWTVLQKRNKIKMDQSEVSFYTRVQEVDNNDLTSNNRVFVVSKLEQLYKLLRAAKF